MKNEVAIAGVGATPYYFRGAAAPQTLYESRRRAGGATTLRTSGHRSKRFDVALIDHFPGSSFCYWRTTASAHAAKADHAIAQLRGQAINGAGAQRHAIDTFPRERTSKH